VESVAENYLVPSNRRACCPAVSRQSSHSGTRAASRVRLITRRPWTDIRKSDSRSGVPGKYRRTILSFEAEFRPTNAEPDVRHL